MTTMPEQRPPTAQLDCAALVRDLTGLGVPRGGLLMVHSSLRSLGHVAGGAPTVIDALLQTLGPDGTLVLPAFTYPLSRDPDFVFDPIRTPSLMGAISDAGRRHPEARRSLHLWHSISAIGPLAETIVTAGGESAWDAGSPMRQIRDRDGLYLLLGVPYQNLTAVHVSEIELQVPYRKPVWNKGTMRRSDGSLVPFVSIGCPPQPGHPGSDFNRLGQRMEDASLVKVGHVGNAVARLLGGHDLRRMASDLYHEDDHGFLRQGGVVTGLSYGHTIESDRGEHCVADPSRMYGAE
ncbi:MAG: AAC(3) family N-acetyltransferase [Chloroflexi bacterium]|nr:AAC(3) family N-acetyltransferase [Chloroflexota bacterium]